MTSWRITNPDTLMRLNRNLQRRVICALILIGALVSCSPAPTPVAVATSTVIPSTSTPTDTPLTPTVTRRASQEAPLIGATPTIATIFEVDIVPDYNITLNIMNDLAQHLDIPSDRIQIVSVERENRLDRILGCVSQNIPPDSTSQLSSENMEESNGFRYTLLVGLALYEYRTQGTNRVVRCPGTDRASGELLITVDPLAAETFRVVQNLLAGELDISSRRVQLQEMLAVVWEDTSLGCPQPDQSYTEATIPGYHIVVTAGTETYIYHSDSNTVYPCPLEQSAIPAN